MKLLICSDIHGDADSAKRIFEIAESESVDKVVVLGDMLYHGPRNDLPNGYNPKAVISILNENRDKILAVRGNCDTEVDQMVLNFPILADYAFLSIDGLDMLITHGHKYNEITPPPIKKGEILIHGHTHIPTFLDFGNENVCINPGSVSIPKEVNYKSFIVYENRIFSLFDLDGKLIEKRAF